MRPSTTSTGGEEEDHRVPCVDKVTVYAYATTGGNARRRKGSKGCVQPCVPDPKCHRACACWVWPTWARTTCARLTWAADLPEMKSWPSYKPSVVFLWFCAIFLPGFPQRDPPPQNRPILFALFFRPIFALFFPSWEGPLVELWRGSRPNTTNVHVLALKLSCETWSSLKMTPPPQTRNLGGIRPWTALTVPREDPREGRKNENCGGRGKKARNFGPPTLFWVCLLPPPTFGPPFKPHLRTPFLAPFPSLLPPSSRPAWRGFGLNKSDLFRPIWPNAVLALSGLAISCTGLTRLNGLANRGLAKTDRCQIAGLVPEILLEVLGWCQRWVSGQRSCVGCETWRDWLGTFRRCLQDCSNARVQGCGHETVGLDFGRHRQVCGFDTQQNSNEVVCKRIHNEEAS